MIYPGTFDIVILQNSTWKAQFRATNSAQTATVDVATAVFTTECHGLVANDAVCITSTGKLPCGINPNNTYYVISSGLTTSQFKVSSTLGGSSVSLSGTVDGVITVSKPINLTGYTVDADITGFIDNAFIATFVASITDSVNGRFELSLTPAATLGVNLGKYSYDVSLTSPSGERYYWVTGSATLVKTCSRN